MTRGEADESGAKSALSIMFHLSSQLVLLQKIISGSLAFFPLDTCFPFAVTYLLSFFLLTGREKRWFRTLSSEASTVPVLVVV